MEDKPLRFATVVGARPQFVKLAPVSSALRQLHQEVIIHTGQHYDDRMSAMFFRELDIPAPDYNLNIGSGPHGAQTGRMLEALEAVLLKEKVDGVIVFGDTNSTLAAALAAAKLNMPIAHIEAGLRGFDRSIPEEINRVVTDHLSSRLYCPTETARVHLAHEGIIKGVEVPGDVMYDALLQAQPKLAGRVEPLLAAIGMKAGAYVLTTVHRPASTENPTTLHEIADALNELTLPVIFPVHPRTRGAIERAGITWRHHVRLIDPVGYLDMLALEQGAYRIVTDSGGVQREAFLLQVPCVTLRDRTEWPETTTDGWNTLAGVDRRSIVEAVLSPPPKQVPDTTRAGFGCGDAAQRIAQSLSNWP